MKGNFFADNLEMRKKWKKEAKGLKPQGWKPPKLKDESLKVREFWKGMRKGRRSRPRRQRDGLSPRVPS